MVIALTAATVRPALIFEGVFLSSTLRLWTGNGTLSWNSQSWLGNGWFAGISDVQEQNEISPSNLDITLAGVPLSLVSLILSESTHASTGKVWLLCFDSSRSIITNPYLLFKGTLSAPRIDDSSDTSQIVLTYENDLINLQRSSGLRYNHETQQALYPDDLGFQYVAGLANWTGFFGYKTKPKPVTARKPRPSKSRVNTR
jgi:hypothetical protein